MESKVIRLNKKELIIVNRALWNYVEYLIQHKDIYNNNEEILEMYINLEEKTRAIIKKIEL